WSRNTFNRVASRWGSLLNGEELEDGDFYSTRLCICTKMKTVVSESFKMAYRGKICWVRAIEVPGWVPDFEDESDEMSYDAPNEDVEPGGEVSIQNDLDSEGSVDEVPKTCFDDMLYKQNMKDNAANQCDSHSENPFGIYEVLNKKREKCNIDNITEGSLKYPPGFTPNGEGDGSGVASVNEIEENSTSDERVNDMNVEKQGNVRNGVQRDTNESNCSGHFKKSTAPRTGGSILHLIDDLVKVGQTMGFDMSGCMKNMEEIIESQGVNDETKMEKIDLWCIKRCWGNLAFDYTYSKAVGTWVPSGMKMLIVSVYAPQEFKEKRMLWDYLCTVVRNWDGQVVIMGDFNEVRDVSERFGSIFNKKGAEIFNNFINNAGLVEVPLGGCSFTWCHKSAKKMSKLDRFLIFDNLICVCPNLSSISLDRLLSDHRPILMRECHGDYGPTPFKFFHYWFEIDGFDKFVEESWKDDYINDQNPYNKFMKKLKLLKENIRTWISIYKERSKGGKRNLKTELDIIDKKIDRGEGNDSDINRRHDIIRLIQDIECNTPKIRSQRKGNNGVLRQSTKIKI
ncbi:RNA-directed DNA polymerase, eukaryota, partial [Tanacetum coccineum]